VAAFACLTHQPVPCETTHLYRLFAHPDVKVLQDLRGKPATSLIRKSAEGIDVQPIYTAENVKVSEAPSNVGVCWVDWTPSLYHLMLQGLEISQLSGEFPYTRGVRASMYTVKPWTIRQVRG
jgi:methylmalonyl-CoA mutase